MQRILTLSDNFPRKNRTASESYSGVQTFMGITEDNLMEVRFCGDNLMGQIFSPSSKSF